MTGLVLSILFAVLAGFAILFACRLWAKPNANARCSASPDSQGAPDPLKTSAHASGAEVVRPSDSTGAEKSPEHFARVVDTDECAETVDARRVQLKLLKSVGEHPDSAFADPRLIIALGALTADYIQQVTHSQAFGER